MMIVIAVAVRVSWVIASSPKAAAVTSLGMQWTSRGTVGLDRLRRSLSLASTLVFVAAKFCGITRLRCLTNNPIRPYVRPRMRERNDGLHQSG
jgi:hypothetical protein